MDSQAWLKYLLSVPGPILWTGDEKKKKQRHGNEEGAGLISTVAPADFECSYSTDLRTYFPSCSSFNSRQASTLSNQG